MTYDGTSTLAIHLASLLCLTAQPAGQLLSSLQNPLINHPVVKNWL